MSDQNEETKNSSKQYMGRDTNENIVREFIFEENEWDGDYHCIFDSPF